MQLLYANKWHEKRCRYYLISYYILTYVCLLIDYRFGFICSYNYGNLHLKIMTNSNKEFAIQITTTHKYHIKIYPLEYFPNSCCPHAFHTYTCDVIIVIYLLSRILESSELHKYICINNISKLIEYNTNIIQRLITKYYTLYTCTSAGPCASIYVHTKVCTIIWVGVFSVCEMYVHAEM